MLNSFDIIKNYVDIEGMYFRFELFFYELYEVIVIILFYLFIKKIFFIFVVFFFN